jgi:DNA-binding IclR family transcriptional regulator
MRSYTLGPRIIVLDHYIRQADPVLQHGVPFMKELVAQTGLDCVVSALYGQQLLDTHREFGAAPASLSYGRGRPRPLFLGGAPKVILAHFAPARCTSCSTPGRPRCRPPVCPPTGRRFAATTRASARPASTCRSASSKRTWRRWLRRCKSADGSVLGALSLVTTVQRMAVIDLPKLAQLVVRAAQDITVRIP